MDSRRKRVSKGGRKRGRKEGERVQGRKSVAWQEECDKSRDER
jgi:hypothetical protein